MQAQDAVLETIIEARANESMEASGPKRRGSRSPGTTKAPDAGVSGEGFHDLGDLIGRHGIGHPVLALVPAGREELFLCESHLLAGRMFEETSCPCRIRGHHHG